MTKLNLRAQLVYKINNIKPGEVLELTDSEIKYCVERWITGNYHDHFKIKEIKFFHYIDPEDPEGNRELIGAKVLKSE